MQETLSGKLKRCEKLSNLETVQIALGLQTQPKHKTLTLDPGRRYFTFANNQTEFWTKKMGLNG